MPAFLHIPEFFDQYEFTKYPFMDTATLISTDGQALDHDIFVDAILYPIGVTDTLHISSIVVAARAVQINIADSLQRVKCSTVFDPLFAPQLLQLVDQYGRPAGALISTSLKLARLTAWQTVTHTFIPAATTFVPSVTIPTPEVGVRGILTTSGDLFVGDFLLVGDNGVVVREETPGCIRIDIVGNPLFRRQLCTPVELFTTPRFVKTINGCPPDQYGNFNLTVGDHADDSTILRIYSTNTGLVIGAAGANTKGPAI